MDSHHLPKSISYYPEVFFQEVIRHSQPVCQVQFPTVIATTTMRKKPKSCTDRRVIIQNKIRLIYENDLGGGP